MPSATGEMGRVREPISFIRLTHASLLSPYAARIEREHRFAMLYSSSSFVPTNRSDRQHDASNGQSKEVTRSRSSVHANMVRISCSSV
jgi:hypothetical protein